MSDKLLERIAVALETIAKVAGSAATPAPAAAGAGANKGAAGATTGAAGANKGAAGATTGATGANKGAAGAGAGKATPGGANKGAAGAAPPAKAPGGKFNSEQVRDIIRKVATNPSLGKQSALDILDQDGGGVTNVTNLKPEFFDAVYEACQVLLSGEGSNQQAGTEEEFDPTA